jgi:hypothetical protein
MLEGIIIKSIKRTNIEKIILDWILAPAMGSY